MHYSKQMISTLSVSNQYFAFCQLDATSILATVVRKLITVNCDVILLPGHGMEWNGKSNGTEIFLHRLVIIKIISCLFSFVAHIFPIVHLKTFSYLQHSARVASYTAFHQFAPKKLNYHS